jgi:DNA polymerase IIIc chi subunit
MNTALPKVIFFEVKTAQDKLKKIFQTTLFHLEKKESLLLLVPDVAAGMFIDEWLWKIEETSFLPHAFSEEPLDEEPILISTKLGSSIRPFLFNLCPDVPSEYGRIKIFYEFDDSSSSLRSEIAKKKFHIYREKDFLIESR